MKPIYCIFNESFRNSIVNEDKNFSRGDTGIAGKCLLAFPGNTNDGTILLGFQQLHFGI